MRSNGYTLRIACCASCTPCNENSPSKGWVGGYIKRVPPSPLLAPKSPEPKGFGRLDNVNDSQEESVMRNMKHASAKTL